MVEIKKDDTKTLIALVSQEIDRVGEARKKHGFYDSGHFYNLIDIHNKLLATPLDEEPALLLYWPTSEAGNRSLGHTSSLAQWTTWLSSANGG